MNPTTPVNWYFEGFSLALAALSYLLIARLALELTFDALGDNLVFRSLRRLTEPFVRAVGAITPRILPLPLVAAGTVAWVFAARILLVQIAAALAMRRMMG